MKKLIAVCGSGGLTEEIPDNVLSIAHDIGFYIAKNNAVVVTGGRKGVMKAACKGAKKANGVTLGLLPNGKSEANEYVDIALGTDLSFHRNFLIARVSDCLIAVGGGWGTLSEISAAMIIKKPIVLIETSFGFVDSLIKADMINQKQGNISLTDDAEQAVTMACALIDKSNQAGKI